MSVFDEIAAPGQIETSRDFREIQRMVRETIERGYVREIPVSRLGRTRPPEEMERWFIELESGTVFSLRYGYFDGERGHMASWTPVRPGEMLPASLTVQ